MKRRASDDKYQSVKIKTGGSFFSQKLEVAISEEFWLNDPLRLSTGWLWSVRLTRYLLLIMLKRL